MIFGRKRKQQEEQQSPSAEQTRSADGVEAAVLARKAMWSAVGEVDDYVVSHAINPAFMGGPRWPALRQAFLKVTLPNGLVLMASDGLSDPYDDEESPNTGLGVE